jgi:hypothetical protein
MKKTMQKKTCMDRTNHFITWIHTRLVMFWDEGDRYCKSQ